LPVLHKSNEHYYFLCSLFNSSLSKLALIREQATCMGTVIC
jgi:hypothetical protein